MMTTAREKQLKFSMPYGLGSIAKHSSTGEVGMIVGIMHRGSNNPILDVVVVDKDRPKIIVSDARTWPVSIGRSRKKTNFTFAVGDRVQLPSGTTEDIDSLYEGLDGVHYSTTGGDRKKVRYWRAASLRLAS